MSILLQEQGFSMSLSHARRACKTIFVEFVLTEGLYYEDLISFIDFCNFFIFNKENKTRLKQILGKCGRSKKPKEMINEMNKAAVLASFIIFFTVGMNEHGPMPHICQSDNLMYVFPCSSISSKPDILSPS